MGSLRFAAVLFRTFSDDHPPPHIHAKYGDMKAVLDLISGGGVELSDRDDRLSRNAKRNEVRRVLRVARFYEAELRSFGGRRMERLLTEKELEAPLDDATEAAITDAMGNARDFYDDEVATSVKYVPAEDMYVLVLRSGRRVLIAREDLQNLAEATPWQAADVSLEILNSAVHWEQLDIDFSVKGLARGIFGNDRWMKKLEERNSPVAA